MLFGREDGDFKFTLLFLSPLSPQSCEAESFGLLNPDYISAKGCFSAYHYSIFFPCQSFY